VTARSQKVAGKDLSVSAVSTHAAWWQSGVVYQVYPRSFQDSNADGVGDLRGVISRLDYLESLGVDAVWLSPIFRSPMADFGYDVAEYRDVDPMFGTLNDLDALIAELHARRMHLLLDLVPNHTSNEHPWFLDSRSSRESEHRDWYIWRDARPDGSPPNGWVAAFGGSAWQWDEGTQQFYFHSFLAQQPDLNWKNPNVRAAMFDVMRFWFKRGVDGFRIDVVNLLAKRYELVPLADDVPIDTTIFGDAAREGLVLARQRWAASTAIYKLIGQLRSVADEFSDRVLVGEIWLPVRRLVRFYGRDLRGLQMPFNFQLITIPWTPLALHHAIAEYEAALPQGAWPNWVVGNHDRSRIATRVGAAQARVAALLLLTLRGTPTMYYGDEIGMTDVPVPVDMRRDPQGLRGGESRDPERTPMRWDGSPTGGFTTATPWLLVGEDVGAINVKAESDDDRSMLSLYRRLLALRREERALNVGEWRDLGRNDAAIAYLRSDGERRFMVVANLTDKPCAVPVAARDCGGRVVLSTVDPNASGRFDPSGQMAANEAMLVIVD
jgi:alpha-glucosidase